MNDEHSLQVEIWMHLPFLPHLAHFLNVYHTAQGKYLPSNPSSKSIFFNLSWMKRLDLLSLSFFFFKKKKSFGYEYKNPQFTLETSPLLTLWLISARRGIKHSSAQAPSLWEVFISCRRLLADKKHSYKPLAFLWSTLQLRRPSREIGAEVQLSCSCVAILVAKTLTCLSVGRIVDAASTLKVPQLILAPQFNRDPQHHPASAPRPAPREADSVRDLRRAAEDWFILRDTHIQRASICWFTLPMSVTAGAGPGLDQGDRISTQISSSNTTTWAITVAYQVCNG